jgi:putative CocE/NonD family hydrolase
MKKTLLIDGKPPAEAQHCRIVRNIQVPMRDGVKLSSTLFLPLKDGRYPVVLIRTAYNRVNYCDTSFPTNGMILVVQDCRGRYEAGGKWRPLTDDTRDGLDTLKWIHRQPWCNGRIGMFGDSYLAYTQYAVGAAGGKYLTALNPRFCPGDWWKRAFYCDGAFSLALTWSWLCVESSNRISEAGLLPRFEIPKLLRKLPIIRMDEYTGAGKVPHYRLHLTHNRYDAFWKKLNAREEFHRYTTPVFITGGWFDNYPAETTANFVALRQAARSRKLRDSHRMQIGPWMHGIGDRKLGDLDFGPDATSENDATFRWLDCLLHGGSPADFQKAPARIFVMGLNRWRDEYEWPLARTCYVNYYLQAGGGLGPEIPGRGKPDRYVYDPEDPVPTLGGNHSVGPYNPGLYEHAKPGPFDQRPNERRRDVLVYTSEPLQHDTEITGPVTLKLFASSSARDTDFIAKLVDVYPDGRAINMTEGVIRARFRENVWGSPKLMTPGKIYEFTIDMQVTANVFKRRHRIRVDLMSSNFPLWDRNLNTGNDPATDTTIQVAEQTIYHDAEHPSHIVLPVVWVSR